MEVRTIEKYKFYRKGQVVADIGIIELYDILQGLKSTYETEENLDIRLEANCLVVDNLKPKTLYDYIIEHEIFQVFLNGIRDNLNKKGLEEVVIEKLNIGNFKEIIVQSSLEEKDKEFYLDKFSKKYFPYVRNSGKYGANSGSEENFHHNFRELIDLVFKMNNKNDDEQREILKKYEPIDEKCTVCHTNIATRLDITHKDEKKERINSKYNYSFFGSEKSTFNNYGEGKNSICFECEFLNLMFLLYISRKRPQVLGYTDDLYFLRYINNNLMLKKRIYQDAVFQLKLGKLKGKGIRLYDVITDSNKGVILTFQSLTDYEELIQDIELIHIVDNYNYSHDKALMRDRCKKYIRYKNYEALRDTLISSILSFGSEDKEEILSNITNYQKFINILNSIQEGGGSSVEDNGFYKLGERLKLTMISSSDEEAKNNRKNIALRITNMLKADDRAGIFDFLTHLIIVNNVEMPYKYSETILDSTKNELHYCIGKFLEGFLK